MVDYKKMEPVPFFMSVRVKTRGLSPLNHAPKRLPKQPFVEHRGVVKCI